MQKSLLYSFIAFSSFSIMDVINKFIFSSANIKFFNYVALLDFSTLVCFIVIFSMIHKKSTSIYKSQGNNYKPIIVRSILSLINTICSLFAIANLPLHIFYSLTFMQPLIAVTLSCVLLIERINVYKIFVVVLGFIGLLISINFFNYESYHASYYSILAGLGIAITGALSGIIIKKYMPNENVLTIGFYNISLSLIVAIVYIFISHDYTEMSSISICNLILIFTAGLLVSLGMMFFMLSYQKGHIQSIVSMQYIQIVWGIIFGYIIFHMIPNGQNILGISIIIIANLLNIFHNNKKLIK